MKASDQIINRSILSAMAEAERKAWDSLGRYKFLMFGYHAATWVTLRKQLIGEAPENPFRGLVLLARAQSGRP